MIKPDTYFLVKSLKDGDLNSLEKLYKLYYSKLYGFAKKFDQASLDPDDFVQQTFVKLWDNRCQLKEDVLLDKQIFVICKNLILNQLKRDKKIIFNLKEDLVHSEEKEEDFSEENNLHRKLLYTAIQKLPQKRKKIFLLHKVQNYTYNEIAEFLDISQKTIANHIYLATTFIKEELKKT